MDNHAQGRLGDIFPRVEVLPISARLQLCELLATARSMPAVLTTEMVDVPAADLAVILASTQGRRQMI